MSWRYPFLFIVLAILFISIIGRLFYWQVVKAEMLSELAISQYTGVWEITPTRGEIKASDGFSIVANKISYLLFANPREIKDVNKTLDKLQSIVEIDKASVSASLAQDKLWVAIKSGVSAELKGVIEKSNIPGIGFEEQFVRFGA